MMQQPTVAFIGAGHLAKALITGLIINGYDSDKIWASNQHQEKIDNFAKHFDIHVTTENQEAILAADIIVLAVRPPQVRSVCREINRFLDVSRQVAVSVAAGITINSLTKWLGEEQSIIRAMPNIAASVGACATALYASENVVEEHKDVVEGLFRLCGTTTWLMRESDMNIVVGLSGSGLAFYFLLMEAMQEVAVKMGLDEKTTNLLVVQTALGAAKLAMESDQQPAQLRAAVASPGGTTEQALNILEQADFRNSMCRALTAAKQRSEAIGDNHS